jgi:hypothetical protein
VKSLRRDRFSFTGQLAGGDASGLNPVASTTYYIGALFGVDPATTDGPPGFWIPKAARLIAVYGRITAVGTHSDAANCSLIIRKNGSTDILTISTTFQITAAANDFNSVNNSVVVAQGDNLYLKFVGGAWGTPPTLVFFNLDFYFEA